MNSIKPNSLMKDTKLFWPLKSMASLDSYLFDENFIKDIFYKFIPQKYKCTQITVRKGLQTIYKKSFSARNTASKKEEIAVAICSSFKARAHLPNMKIILARENNFSNGPRIVQKLNSNLPRLLWLYYTEGDHKDLVDWTISVAEIVNKIDSKYYITSKSLSEKFEHQKCPIEFNSKEIARIITIFAGQLDEQEERISLLKTAIELGNTFLNVPDVRLLQAKEKGKLEPYKSLMSLPDVRISTNKIKENDEINQIINSQADIQRQRQQIREIDEILLLSKKDLDKQLKKIIALRSKTSEAAINSKRQIKILNQKLSKMLNFMLIAADKIIQTDFENTEKLIEYCLMTDQIIQLNDQIYHKEIVHYFLKDSSNISCLNELKNTLENALDFSQKSNSFVINMGKYLKKLDDEIQVNLNSKIQQWTFDEGVAFLTQLTQKEHALSFSVLWAYLF